MTTKRFAWVPDQFGTISSNVDLESAKTEIEDALAAEARGEWKGLNLQVVYNYDEYEMVIMGLRPETNGEAVQRQQHLDEQVKVRREQYEKLKKEFDDGDKV